MGNANINSYRTPISATREEVENYDVDIAKLKIVGPN